MANPAEETVGIAEEARRLWRSHMGDIAAAKKQASEAFSQIGRRAGITNAQSVEFGKEAKNFRRGVRQMGVRVGSGIGQAAWAGTKGVPGFLGRHRKMLAVSVAGLAAFQAHPLRATGQDVSDMLWDDPNRIHNLTTTLGRGAIVSGLNGVGVGASLSQTQPAMSYLAHEQLPNYYRGPNPNPDGALVFNLWNQRLKG